MYILISLLIILLLLNWLSYKYMKNKVLKRERWDLNICAGKTDGGGVNADIFKHTDLPNFVLIRDIYHLPFRDGEFKTVLCSHTIEHVDHPKIFYRELCRVGESVTLVTPPLWDLIAVFNFVVHKWIVVSFKKEHTKLPMMIPYPLGILYDKLFGQAIKV